MALIRDYEIPSGINISAYFEDLGFEYVTKDVPYLANNVYIKIEKIETTTNKECVMAVSFKKDKDTAVLFTKTYSYNLSLEDSAGNVFQQGYRHLKSLDDFKGAMDV